MAPKQPTSAAQPSSGIEWSRVLGHDYGADFARSMEPPPMPSQQHAEMCEYELSEMNKITRAKVTPRTQRRAKEAYWEFLDCMAKGMFPARYKSVFSQCVSPKDEQIEKCNDLKMGNACLVFPRLHFNCPHPPRSQIFAWCTFALLLLFVPLRE